MSLRRIDPAPVREPYESPNWNRWYNSVTNRFAEIVLYEETINPTSVSANTTSEQTFTITGVDANDYVLSVNKPSHQTGLGIVGYRVSAANQIAITFMNTTGGAIDPSSEEYKIITVRG